MKDSAADGPAAKGGLGSPTTEKELGLLTGVGGAKESQEAPRLGLGGWEGVEAHATRCPRTARPSRDLSESLCPLAVLGTLVVHSAQGEGTLARWRGASNRSVSLSSETRHLLRRKLDAFGCSPPT